MRFEANEWNTFVESIGNENEKEKKSEEKQFLRTVSLCLSSQMNKASTSFFSRHPKKKKEKKRKCLCGPPDPGLCGPQDPGLCGPPDPGLCGPPDPGLCGPPDPGLCGPPDPGLCGPPDPGLCGPPDPGLCGPPDPGFLSIVCIISCRLRKACTHLRVQARFSSQSNSQIVGALCPICESCSIRCSLYVEYTMLKMDSARV